ncbi:trehalase isoform X2 [Stomoxys calcitrans]|uniref:trehalase isoform X2 n=1 Tax=Stomoxys calcitrans TaxID=35570 RepID=UPI0027E21F34|nr:trehalase isoform X2 [Stomoxys calcitrans]
MESNLNSSEAPQDEIYCHGELLHTVQMAHLFADSKTFVDMKLKKTPQETMNDFTEFMTSKNNEPTRDEIREFVDLHFDDLGKEFVPWTPVDWKDHPAFLDNINDPDLKQWGTDLNLIWKDLGRKMIDDVHKNPHFYSIIPVNNPVIVPGGRFIEFYYWDSYWIIRGLLYSQMYDTARGMLENFMSIVQRFGFIPNGGRIYYAQRSQPPLLAAMIKSYVDFTNDTSFGTKALEVLEHEFEYWMNNHTTQAKGHNVCTYGGISPGPRPESYREDIETSMAFKTEEEKQEHYAELKAGAESGMDFSSRWFINDKGEQDGDLTNLKTRAIVPVELNAILHWSAKIIAEFHRNAGNATKAEEYENKAANILKAIEAVHWSEEVGAWLDYDLTNNKHRNYFVPTNLAPLWTMSYDKNSTEHISKLVLDYIEKLELDKYPGGVPNTLYRTGEQWDFPNVWPPMQYLLIKGLENLGTNESKELSTRWAHRWVKSNFQAYRETQAMFEKYDAERFGGHGGGGEYEVQKGFGWTNGVIIEFLNQYGKDITLPSKEDNGANLKMWSLMGIAAIALVAVIVGRVMW